MAVTFVAAGSVSATAASATVSITAPTCSPGDILIATVLGKDNLVTTLPTGWAQVAAVNNTSAQRLTVAWKRASLGDSGAAFNFVKSSNNAAYYGGVIAAFTGATSSGNPINEAAPSTSANASSDDVTYATFTPVNNRTTLPHIVAIGVYNDDLTTAGAIAGTDPTLTNRWDLEDTTDTDASFFGYSGDTATYAATGARTGSTTSTADAISIGCVFAIDPYVNSMGGGINFTGPSVREHSRTARKR